MKLLPSVAMKSGDARLSALAVTSRIAAFSKPKETIQDMVNNFVVEKEDEIKHKDFNIEELGQSEVEFKARTVTRLTSRRRSMTFKCRFMN